MADKEKNNIASFDINDLSAVQIGLASPETIRGWSHGEVTRAETINYRSQKPEKGGLFCEKIFGPAKDYECNCGKYKKIRFKGITCEKCGVEVISKEWRRERMGHIELVSPCSHIWYLKSIPSRMGLALQMPPKQLEDVIYFNAWVCLNPGDSKVLSYKEYLDETTARGDASGEGAFCKAIREILARKPDDVEEVDGQKVTPSYVTEHRYIEEGSSDFDRANSLINRFRSPTESFSFYEGAAFISKYTKAEFGQGAESIKRLLHELGENLEQEFQNVAAELKKADKETAQTKTSKRLEVLGAFRSSHQKPEWMILDVIPVIPPDLRPMIQLEGGRSATSDVNDLYRRVISRNTRLKKLIDANAPRVILVNEKRMLQEAVDALIDNGRRTKAVTGTNNRKLKSLSAGLRGKPGRFRQNLLGKRVDYSGRSVIAVGPDLKMYQCGIPREMAVQLLRPFIAAELIKSKFVTAHKAADRYIDRYDPHVFDIVERIISDHPVLLNRAPTLHRLSIQAFQPKLVDGKAIRLHPLVCPGFNADFDGDQMAVHVPLGKAAQQEAVELMLASNNILSPKDGKAIVIPSQDMILGNFHLTTEESKEDFASRIEELSAKLALEKEKGVASIEHDGIEDMIEADERYMKAEGKVFHSTDEVVLAYENREVSLHNRIAIPASAIHKDPGTGMPEGVEGKYLITSVGKIIFNNVFPDDFPYLNDKPGASEEEMRSWFVSPEDVYAALGDKLDLSPEAPSPIAQYIATLPLKSAIGKKQLGPIIDMVFSRYGALKTSAVLDKIKDQGFYYSMISSVTVAISDIKDIDGKYPMVEEGYKEVEDTNSFYREGYLTAEERHRRIVEIWKGITDKIADKIKANMKADKRNPLIIMADSGSRGSVDNFKQLIGMKGLVANPKNVEIELPIVSSYREGMKVSEFFINTHGARKGSADTALKTADSGYLTRRLVDVAQDVIVREDDCHCDHGFVVREIRDTSRDTVIMKLSDRIAGRFTMHDIIDPNTGEIIVRENTLISDEQAKQVEKAGITEVEIRSVFTCQTKEGVCRHCYGLNRATGKLVEKGEAVGIMAAQSIGEPGTQLTMRVFHTGGMAGSDITQGLPRVQELVEARDPKGKAIISKFDGEVVSITPDGEKNKVRVKGSADNDFTYEPLQAARLRVKVGDHVEAGAKITDGAINPKDLLECAGVEKLEIYLIKEIQKVYAAQGIGIDCKHLEIIIRQMLRKVVIRDPGDTDLLPGSRVSVEAFTEANGKVLLEGKRPAVCVPFLLGITKAALETDSFLSAASFQETTRVLTDAAIKAKKDPLHGLKENVIAGKLIPAGTGLRTPAEEEKALEGFSVAEAMRKVKLQYIEKHDRTDAVD